MFGPLARPVERLLGAPPVLLQRLALPGEDRDALRVLGRAVGPTTTAAAAWSWVEKMLQRDPADLGAERVERLDQHGGLDRHVQRADDARALERLRVGVLLAGRHQAGHLVLGEPDLLAAELGQREVGDLEVGASWVAVALMRSPCGWGVRSAAAAASSRSCLSCSKRSQSRGGDVGRTLGLGLEPRLDRGAEARRRGAGVARSRCRRGRRRAVEQLAQRAQALQLGRAVEAVADRRAGGLDEPDAARCSAACAATNPSSRAASLIVSASIRCHNLTTIVSRLWAVSGA